MKRRNQRFTTIEISRDNFPTVYDLSEVSDAQWRRLAGVVQLEVRRGTPYSDALQRAAEDLSPWAITSEKQRNLLINAHMDELQKVGIERFRIWHTPHWCESSTMAGTLISTFSPHTQELSQEWQSD